MAGRRRLYTAGSFILSVFSLVLIMVSAATDYWVQADVRVQSGAGRPDTLHYGLYGGKVDFAQTSPPVRNVLHVVCVLSAKACAVTCKTTPAARRQEVIYLSTGYRPATLACDDNTNFNRHQPQAGQRPVLSTALYVAVNLFLLLQLLYALCSALLALVNTFEDLTHPLLGLQGMALTSCACALKGTMVLLIWGIHCSRSKFRDHLAFAYVAAQTTHVSASVGYSYWLLLLAVLFSLGSTALASLRMYFDGRGKV